MSARKLTIALALFVSASASVAGLTELGSTGTIQDVIDGGGSFRADGLAFSDFDVVGQATPGSTAAQADGITLQVVRDDDTGQVGLRFDGYWNAEYSGQSVWGTIRYKVAADPPLPLSGDTLYLLSYAAPDPPTTEASVKITADSFPSAHRLPDERVGHTHVAAKGSLLESSSTFPTPVHEVWVAQDIGVDAGVSGAFLLQYAHTLAQVPEPVCLAFLAAGGGLLVLRPRRPSPAD